MKVAKYWDSKIRTNDALFFDRVLRGSHTKFYDRQHDRGNVRCEDVPLGAILYTEVFVQVLGWGCKGPSTGKLKSAKETTYQSSAPNDASQHVFRSVLPSSLSS